MESQHDLKMKHPKSLSMVNVLSINNMENKSCAETREGGGLALAGLRSTTFSEHLLSAFLNMSQDKGPPSEQLCVVC